MQIRIRETGKLITEQQFRELYANTTFPAQITESILNDFGADVVFEGPQISGGEFWQFPMRQGVEQINGKWYTKYVLGPVFKEYADQDGVVHTVQEQQDKYVAEKTSEKASDIRQQRDQLLIASDWTQVADAPVDQAAWATYRQALRDITAQPGFPHNIEWPTPPQ